LIFYKKNIIDKKMVTSILSDYQNPFGKHQFRQAETKFASNVSGSPDTDSQAMVVFIHYRFAY